MEMEIMRTGIVEVWDWRAGAEEEIRQVLGERGHRRK